jgi:hypothetical protein
LNFLQRYQILSSFVNPSASACLASLSQAATGSEYAFVSPLKSSGAGRFQELVYRFTFFAVYLDKRDECAMIFSNQNCSSQRTSLSEPKRTPVEGSILIWRCEDDDRTYPSD